MGCCTIAASLYDGKETGMLQVIVTLFGGEVKFSPPIASRLDAENMACEMLAFTDVSMAKVVGAEYGETLFTAYN